MDATENKELREQLEQKQHELESVTKENANMRMAIQKMQGDLRQVGHVMEVRERVAELMDIATFDNKMQPKEKFDRGFMHRVKCEIMYLTNGWDPNGYFQPEKKEPAEPEQVQTEELPNEGQREPDNA